jgi:hypothetical protein
VEIITAEVNPSPNSLTPPWKQDLKGKMFPK